MSVFITSNFLLNNEVSKTLYHDYAEGVPIIDYHCHIPVEDIARNTQFKNLTHVWLYGDHYKWRAMRTAGVDENYITGNASDWEKFLEWAKVVPKTLGNPLYHWTHLELLRYFGVDELLNEKSAERIWKHCNDLLSKPELSARGIIKKMNVRVVCTTDDPVDSLEYHKQIAEDNSFDVKVLPAFRPDKAMSIEDPTAYKEWLDKLSKSSGISINSYKDLLAALKQRHDFFHERGCRLSDHGLETVYADDYTDNEVNQIFSKVLNGTSTDEQEQRKFKSAILFEMGKLDHSKEWVQQYHLGAIRNNNSRMFRTLGPDTGLDSMGDFPQARSLSRFLDRLDSDNQLTKTILYNVNPTDNALFATMIGNFQDGSVAGKMQYGSAWWFLDQKDGIEAQLRTLANMGLLSHFVGMLTDSRSFLSYPRHEYFRRVLCNMLGADIEKGLIPADMELVGSMIKDICYNNADKYFDF